MSSTAATANDACANCGKAEEGGNKLKTCTSCKMVKYCCRDCQRSHWPKHKKACKKRAAELFDEELFKDTEEREECPICMLPLPLENGQTVFHVCCGKVICFGCIHAQLKEDIKSGKSKKDIGVCAFCREPPPKTDELRLSQLKNGMKKNYAGAFESLAKSYLSGEDGLPRDLVKGRELLLKAGELGYSEAYARLGCTYIKDGGEGNDIKKARHYFELATLKGSIAARNNLGALDLRAGDHERGYKHVVISATAGFSPSLNLVKQGYKEGFITKDEYTEILRAYQKKQEDLKSKMRDEAIVYEANPQLYWA